MASLHQWVMDRSTQEPCAFAMEEYCDGSTCGYMAARRCNQLPQVCQFEKIADTIQSFGAP